MTIVAQFGAALSVYAWGLICVLLLFLYAIARFYQRTAGERSHYRWFLFPFALFAMAALRFTWVGGISGDPYGDGLLCVGGTSLLAVGSFLYHLMMGRRR